MNGNVRIIGVVLGLATVVVSLIQRRRRTITRGEVLARVSVGLGVSIVSLAPAVLTLAADTLRLRNRLFALLVLSTITLFMLRLRDLRRLTGLEQRFGDLVRNVAIREAQANQAGAGEPNKISIVIAAYNEEQAIDGVLQELPREVCGMRVEPLVVVDGGEDETENVVRRGGHLVVTHPVNRGQGDALRTGFRVALRRGADIVVTMDADGQHRPDQLEDLVKPIVADEADYVHGSRFLGEYDEAGSARSVGIRFFARLINLLARTHVTDCTNGFRAVRADKLALLRLEEDRFSAAEIIMEAGAKGLRMQEVPVHIQARSHGESKKPRRLGYPLGFLQTIFRVWLR